MKLKIEKKKELEEQNKKNEEMVGTRELLLQHG